MSQSALNCRSVEREQSWPDDSAIAQEAAALSREPAPEDAAVLVDEVRTLLAPLNSVQRQIVELRLQGHEIDEIAVLVQRTARTVRRTLAGFENHAGRTRLDQLAHDPSRTGLMTFS